MTKSITPKFPKFLHGGDYNPDQWLDRPDILAKDIELMKEAHCNCMSVGIFAWAQLEPEEGVYNLDWLADIIDNLYKNGIYTILATPSGGKPAWMTQKYPEIARVTENGVREIQGGRQNNCYTSPIYREKVRQMDQKLAERFAHHPGVIMWHVYNEHGNAQGHTGACHCEYCQEEFRNWLKAKYKTLDNLNHAWWNHFWSHTFTDWSQVHSPSPLGEMSSMGLLLDWKRFCSDRIVDFIRFESKIVKAYNPDLPVTANLMYMFGGADYYKVRDVIDVASWDNYPYWHTGNWDNDPGEAKEAAEIALCHDWMRSLIPGKPFMLMESCPGPVSWHSASRIKRPGMHLLSSMQAVAHGSDTVQYFQWRMGRGAFEKFHAAVVDHYGESDTRMFKEVTGVGTLLESLQDDVYGSLVHNDVAIVFDCDNRWAIKETQGPRQCGMNYEDNVRDHYRYFWENNIGVDVIDESCDLSGYKLVVAPLMYMLRADFAEKIRAFVENGGTFVTTAFSGIVDETDLCYLGGFPALIGDVMGLRVTETDALYNGQYNNVAVNDKTYRATELCDLLQPSTAKVLGTYASEFYADTPAITVNEFGKGKAYYVGARFGMDFLRDFYPSLVNDADVKPVIGTKLPENVVATRRVSEDNEIIFLMNFQNNKVVVNLDRQYQNIATKEKVCDTIEMDAYGVVVLKVVK